MGVAVDGQDTLYFSDKQKLYKVRFDPPAAPVQLVASLDGNGNAVLRWRMGADGPPMGFVPQALHKI